MDVHNIFWIRYTFPPPAPPWEWDWYAHPSPSMGGQPLWFLTFWAFWPTQHKTNYCICLNLVFEVTRGWFPPCVAALNLELLTWLRQGWSFIHWGVKPGCGSNTIWTLMIPDNTWRQVLISWYNVHHCMATLLEVLPVARDLATSPLSIIQLIFSAIFSSAPRGG